MTITPQQADIDDRIGARPADRAGHEPSRSSASSPVGTDPSRETWESINQWCDDTFGAATVPQIIARAKEEFDELELPDADHAIEAADVVICLCRIPGFADALQQKMAINRKRRWRLVGNGTGYHIPERDSDVSLAEDAGTAAEPRSGGSAGPKGIAQ